MPQITADVSLVVAHLNQGNIAAIPTETVYGLAACANDEAAIEQIFTLKNRPAAHPLIIHLAHRSELGQYASDISDEAEKLAEAFMPGPFTLLLPRRRNAAARAAAGSDLIALRVPALATAHQLIELTGSALAAPSANLYGRPSPTSAQHVANEFSEHQNLLILDGGICSGGLESTIVLATEDRLELVRPGLIDIERLEQAAGRKISARTSGKVPAPGTDALHYSPRQPLKICSREQLEQAEPDAAFLLFGSALPNSSWSYVLPAEPEDAARKFYAALREAEASGCELILAEAPPAGVQWDALRDRLSRAAK